MGNLGSLTIALFFAAQAGAWAASAVVNSETDAPDPIPGDGICDTGFGPSNFTGICTLRAAFQTAQAGDQITFAPGIRTIFINFDIGALVSLRGSIDGGSGRVEITGGGRGAYAITVNPSAAGTNPITIRNLIINGFAGDGIQVLSNLSFVPTNTTIENCFIGTDRTGRVAIGNGADGIVIARTLNTVVRNCIISANGRHGINVNGTLSGDDVGTTIIGCKIGTDTTGSVALPNGANGLNLGNTFINPSATRVGGILPSEGNVISGNLGHGIYIAGQNFPGDFLIQGNVIGTDVLGEYAIPNELNGIALENTDDAVIGGPTPAERNLISGNNGHGISIGNAFSDNHRIQGNYIGPDISGEIPIGNALHGIFIHSGALNVVVGERQADAVQGVATGELGPGNLIAFNGGSGIVSVQAANQGNFRRNRIHSNGEIGIDLGGDGPTPNGTPSGVNFNMPFPIISSIATGGGMTTITGSVNGFGGVSVVDFYRSKLCDPTGFGEGGIYLGTILPATNNFMFQIPGEHRDVTATMTSSMATSEFSPCGEVMVINTVGDASDVNPGDGVCSTGATIPAGGFECTLRAAIEESNADADHTIARFGIRDAGGELVLFPEIAPASALPDVIHPITIDGTTQPGEIIEGRIAPNAPQADIPTLAGTPPGPIVTGAVIPSMRFTAPNSEVRGIALCNFMGDAISVENEGQITVEMCWFGFDPRTMASAKNGSASISLLNSGGNTIGSAQPKKGNLFAGFNSLEAIRINGFRAGMTNTVIGNFFGVGPNGAAFTGEQGEPVQQIKFAVNIINSGGNKIGLPSKSPGHAPGNLIGGSEVGIRISNPTGPADSNVIQGNRIGLDSTGSFSCPNDTGVLLFIDNPNFSIQGTLIGGPAAGDRNVISGNVINGIKLTGVASGGPSIQGTTIQSNYIGTSVSGLSGIGGAIKQINNKRGIAAEFSKGTVIGGKTEGKPGAPPGNIISNNENSGIEMNRETAGRIQGNAVGTAAGGLTALGNHVGIDILSAQGFEIGGDEAGEGNLISGNTATGLFINGGTDLVIQGNIVGTDVDAEHALPNRSGISVAGAINCTIGGAAATPGAPPGNIASGNKEFGISYRGSALGASQALIEGNLIGTQRDGKKPLGNKGPSAIAMFNAIDATVRGNVIAHNDQGVFLDGKSRECPITRNSIFHNQSIGIKLGELGGGFPNDAGDGDGGPNNLQNYPEIQSAMRQNVAGSEQIVAQVKFNSAPNGSYLLEFFGNPAADRSGFGEGQWFIHQQAVTTDAMGDLPGGTVQFTLPDSAPPALFLTATATRLDGAMAPVETSEFSRAVKITGQDSDGDGIPDVVEAAGNPSGQRIAQGGPAGYDGNNDGISDAAQQNVASFPNAGDGRYATLAVPTPAALFQVSPEDPASPPPRLDFPYGNFAFQIADADGQPPLLPIVGGSITADLYLPDEDLSEFNYWKLGHTPIFNWYEFAPSGGTGARFGSGVIHLDFIDGMLGDDDLAADGVVIDPGGPALIGEPWTSVSHWELLE